MPENPEEIAHAAFAEAFGAAPSTLGRAPGRVELLGNHTDYNGGLVLAAAIDRSTVVVGRAVPGREARVFSANLGDLDQFAIDDPDREGPESWGRYVRGVTWAIGQDLGRLGSGFEAALAGDVPIGAGLSSSASLQAAFAMFLIGAGLSDGLEPGGLSDPDRLALAVTLRKSENEFVGVASGLLDQFSALFGRANHAFVLDCDRITHELLPLGDPSPSIIVCDSRTSRRLADGMYNRRRSECERVVAHFREKPGRGGVRWLRDIGLEELRDAWDELDPVARLRARHVLTENDRVIRGAEALRSGDVEGFGALMSASHASSRDDFGNSSPALDALIESAEESPGFLGGKLSGAGWAGCTVNLVRPEYALAFADSIRESYSRRAGLKADVHICRAADGASTWPIPRA
ncbi:galactokinase [Tundrisphaera lichenicola]|uniref:galactokinase n=1 Tax=Tundrisphaera lichenicola TaxID=2029860 RepID=UPI003EC0FB07